MKDKRKTLDKKEENLKFKKKLKKQKLQERGITLIALVVTIIILLILSGVTLNIALSDNGLFSKTKKATEEYKQDQSEEEEAIRQIATQMYSEYVGAKVEGYSPANNEKEVTIYSTKSGVNNQTDDEGNKIENENIETDGKQKFKADTGMKWRVWDFDGNTLRIIGDPTSTALTLEGATGYNNGVSVINEICKILYSNEEKGATATNLKRTDIQRVSTYDYTEYKHKTDDWKEDTTNGDKSSVYFGATKTYTDNYKYPAMWNDNDREWTYEYKEGKSTGKDKEGRKWEETGKYEGQNKNEMKNGSAETIFKQSYYYHNYNENEFINNKYYDLIFKNADANAFLRLYWLGGRCVQLYESCCEFGLQLVLSSNETQRVCGSGLCNSERYDYN